MPTIEEKEYILFMNWLQNTHPGLYAGWWQQITPAVTGEHLTILKGKMDTEIHEALIEATKEFYRNKIK